MISNLNRGAWLVVGLAVIVGVALGLSLSNPGLGLAQGNKEPGPASAGPRYTVVFTEGTNLCVTDNRANKVYFYTVDHGHEPGAELKLRAYVDLEQIGKELITPTLLKKKAEKKP
jgi:hypothetical protein